ncbi:DUF2726 domain-containing protein [Rubritalea profundi]|uniref:DUF2726 domain-containing protein n=1 Tax=Rubritalea profundi TaxID=1658618 RepID=A0A2S7TYT3_9BACT|nr:DUF2726 domain-containing protein [Rubritalea profundi]PQJ27417.1 hypothetical protein BSZ32_02170 [Rubritalea profundi]
MSTSPPTGCLGMLLAPFFKKTTPPTYELSKDRLPYGKRDDFLSAAEISFFHVLQTILTDEHYLLTKVNLGDLFFVRRPHENKGARGRISQKHVDFVICDTSTMEPVLAVELDDRSHEREDRKQRDELVDRVFAAAGLPILHIPAAKGYVTHDIQAQLSEHIHFPSPPHEGNGPSSNPSTQRIEQTLMQNETAATKDEPPLMPISDVGKDDDSTPVCPKCHSEMISRTATKGKHAGNTFWGCINYPKCRHTVDI